MTSKQEIPINYLKINNITRLKSEIIENLHRIGRSQQPSVLYLFLPKNSDKILLGSFELRAVATINNRALLHRISDFIAELKELPIDSNPCAMRVILTTFLSQHSTTYFLAHEKNYAKGQQVLVFVPPKV